MGIETVTDYETGYQVMYCNTTMWAFGGIFYTHDDEDAMGFLKWHEKVYPKRDVRTLSDETLQDRVSDWRAQMKAEKALEQAEYQREMERDLGLDKLTIMEKD